MADRGRRFRERPIDFAKPMPVVKSQKELQMTDDGQLMPKKRDLDGVDGFGESCLMGGLDDDDDDVRAHVVMCFPLYFYRVW
jgi:hypothetical protein